MAKENRSIPSMVPKVRSTNVKHCVASLLPAVSVSDNVSKLIALGFKAEDCITALKNCEEKLDDAALWLTQNAVPVDNYGSSHKASKEEPFVKTVEVCSTFITIAAIISKLTSSL